jgi:hypothetical protein
VPALAVATVALIAALPGRVAAGGSLDEINGYRVLSVWGTPEEMGAAHGVLLREEVQRVVGDVVVDGAGGAGLERLLEGARVMERHLPRDYRAELRALADTAQVDYDQLVALQLFGDIARGQSCTSYAVFGPATETGECICGRNMDYWDYGASEYGAILIHYRPARGHAFVTCSWAGIINGWTTLNDAGIVCSNNSAYGGADSIEGLSTCFMVRKVAQFAGTVTEGVRIVESTPRACGTNLLIAGGSPQDAAMVEYDHERVAARWARDGVVLADNSFRVVGRESPTPDGGDDLGYGRYATLARLIRGSYGRINRSHNFAAAAGVPIRSINLHSALLFPGDRILYVSMGQSPAADHPYHGFRLIPGRLIGLDTRLDGPAAQPAGREGEG